MEGEAPVERTVKSPQSVRTTSPNRSQKERTPSSAQNAELFNPNFINSQNN